MAVEVELKVHLDDAEAMKGRLSALGEYRGSFKKSDSYWIPVKTEAGIMPAPSMGVRVRYENGNGAEAAAPESGMVTYKTKEISGGIEVNNECEFSVSNAALFEELLSRLGLYNDICKEKEGWAWLILPETDGRAPILAELSMVTKLGWFLELEILLSGNDGQTVQESRLRLLALLEKLNIPPERIEARPYTVMLKEIRNEELGIRKSSYFTL
jgi:predicted adenylyl cyclase CyaB